MNDWLVAMRRGVRSLRRDPASSAVAILALAVGIAATSTMFSVFSAVLLKPLPFRDLDRLVAIWKIDTAQPDAWRGNGLGNFADWRRTLNSFEKMAAARNRSFTLTSFEDGGTPLMQEVSCEYFELLGVKMALGRSFGADECRPGGPRVALLSHDLWQRLFAGDPGVLGRSTGFDGQPTEIVGVLPPGFDNPIFGLDVRVQAFLPLQVPAEGAGRLGFDAVVLARLRPDASLEQARAEMERATAALREEYPEAYQGFAGVVTPMAERLTRPARTPVLVLFGAVFFVMLVALGNVANIALTRAIERHREIAIRMALGAGTRALLRQLLGEGLATALLGGALGLALLPLGIRALDLALPRGPLFPRFRFEVDATVVVFSLALALLSGIALGLAPFLHVRRSNAAAGLGVAATRATADPTSRRWRFALVAAEIAMSMVLLVGSGLLTRSQLALAGLDPGFDADQLLTFRVSTRGAAYQRGAQREAFFSRVLEEIRAVPGVSAAGSAVLQPFLDAIPRPVRIDGRPEPPAGQEPRVQARQILPGFEDALRIPLLEGRVLTEADTADGLRVAVVNRAFARRFFGDESPLGRSITLLDEDRQASRQVVGVVGDVRSDQQPPLPFATVFVPLAQDPGPTSMLYVARARVEPLGLLPEIERAVRRVDRGMPVYLVQTMRNALAVVDAQVRFLSWLMLAFAALGLCLAMSGLYAVVSYLVAQRTREIGVRVALGARPRDVLALVLGDAARPALAGVGLGLVAALALSRAIESQLYGVRASDPATYVVLAGALLVTALGASALPARRATRVDPVRALRAD
jgi:putative ABC transport system permease protein